MEAFSGAASWDTEQVRVLEAQDTERVSPKSVCEARPPLGCPQEEGLWQVIGAA